jgi:hypothetical protein
MDSYGIPMDFYGFLWIPMEFLWIPIVYDYSEAPVLKDSVHVLRMLVTWQGKPCAAATIFCCLFFFRCLTVPAIFALVFVLQSTTFYVLRSTAFW